MKNVIDALKTTPITIGKDAKNIDARYFEEENGAYMATPTFIYNVIRDASKWYKNQIFQLDTNCEYHSESIRLTEDTWSDKKKKDTLDLQYSEQIKELERRKREWREQNPDKCSSRAGGPDLGDIDELRFFGGYNPDFRPTLQEALSIYKALYEIDKAESATLKESLPQKPDTLLVMSDYRAEYDALIDKWVTELGIDHDLYFSTFDKVERTVNTIARSNSKQMKGVVADDDGLDKYVEGLIEYVTSSNKVEYRKQREEMQVMIDKDFIVNFNDTVKELKAEEGTNEGEIIIFTKLSEDVSPIKFIVISKENPNDNYKFIMDIDDDGNVLHFHREIATKADLRKALNMAIMLLDGTTFAKYIDDLQRTLDTLG